LSAGLRGLAPVVGLSVVELPAEPAVVRGSVLQVAADDFPFAPRPGLLLPRQPALSTIRYQSGAQGLTQRFAARTERVPLVPCYCHAGSATARTQLRRQRQAQQLKK